MKTGDGINNLTRMLGKLRKNIVDEVTRKTDSDMRQYFSSLATALTDHFGKVHTRIGETESRLGKRLDNVQRDVGELKSDMTEVKATLKRLDERL